MSMRVSAVKPFDISQNQQKMCFSNICDKSREIVVISKFDFIDNNGIIFIDD